MPYDAPELGIEIRDYVATVEIKRPPHNFFDFELIRQLAGTYEALDDDPACRAIVLCSDGKSFCAGANFGSGDTIQDDGSVEGSLNRVGVDHLYVEAVRVFRCRKPVIAAVQGAAIGGGLGLALSTDFRVGCPEARFAANFTRLGFHPGFGLTVTLPRVIGQQKATLMFLTSRRIKGEEALAWGLLDDLTTLDKVRAHAWGLARALGADQEGHVLARLGEPPAEIAADGAGAEHQDVHQRPLKSGRRRSAVAATPSRKSSVVRSRVCSSSSWSVAARTASARPWRIVARVETTPSGALTAISRASPQACARTLSSVVKSSSSPQASASSPLMRREVRNISDAFCWPMTRGSVTVRPKPGWNPRRVKLAAKRDSGLATRKSADMASPSPPPMAPP